VQATANGDAVCGISLVLVAVCFIAHWTMPQTTLPVRISFLFATNNVGYGLAWGTFQLENQMKETLRTGNGIFERCNGRKWLHGLGDRAIGSQAIELGGVKMFAAGTTNLFSTWLPTNVGPYRLVLFCYPNSTTTLEYQKTARFRLGAKLLSVGIISDLSGRGFYDGARMFGAVCPASQAFRPPSPVPLGQPGGFFSGSNSLSPPTNNRAWLVRSLRQRCGLCEKGSRTNTELER
jgi:hypothetical protein